MLLTESSYVELMKFDGEDEDDHEDNDGANVNEDLAVVHVIAFTVGLVPGDRIHVVDFPSVQRLRSPKSLESFISALNKIC